MDTPGIVHAVTSLLRGAGEHLDRKPTPPRALDRRPMFHMPGPADVPGAVAGLHEELAELETQSNLDIRLTPVIRTRRE
jgi:hypothetical protein